VTAAALTEIGAELKDCLRSRVHASEEHIGTLGISATFSVSLML
jgi:hypothetical protein